MSDEEKEEWLSVLRVATLSAPMDSEEESFFYWWFCDLDGRVPDEKTGEQPWRRI